MYAQPSYPFEWIKTSADLSRLSAELEPEPILSVDTETHGWETGNERLCLVQIGAPTRKQVWLIDILAINDPSPIAGILEAATPLIIAHNASFEERQFARYKIKLKGVRDTLTMARTLRPDLPNHTLRTCCRLLLSKELSKEQQTSDWSCRPLSDQQVAYARLDAEVALELYDYLALLEEKVLRDLAADLPVLMEEYATILRRKFELTAQISHELAFLCARQEKIRETIRSKLIDGADGYDGPFGKCLINKVKRTEVNPQKVREMFPEFAAEVIQDFVDRKRFDAVARERGLPKNTIELVLDTIGYTDRLTLALKDEIGMVE